MSSEVLGQQLDQEVMSWDPYANLPEFGEGQQESPEGQLSASPEEMTRTQKQGLGVAAIVGMLESGRTETPAQAEADKTTEVAEEMQEAGDFDTLVGRAEQALGVAQFAGLVQEMMKSADNNPSEVTMREFREVAGGLPMDAGELWAAVVAQSKKERFPDIEEFRENGKFYYSVSLEDLPQILGSGSLKRTDKSGNSLKSDLVLSRDVFENGEGKSGFAEERGAKSTDVVFILDGNLVDEEDFVAIRKNATVDSVDLAKHCLGIISDFQGGVGRKVNQIVRQSGLAEIPVYQESAGEGFGWATSFYPAEILRQQKAEYAEKMRGYQEVKSEVYDEVDRDGLAERIEKLSDKLDLKKLEEIILKYGNPETPGKQKEAHEALLKYYSEALGLKKELTVVYVNKPDEAFRGRRVHGVEGEPIKVLLNEALIDLTDLKDCARTLGHESRHEYQHELADKLEADADGLTEGEKRMAGLFAANFAGYINARDDMYGYQNQIVEVDAQLFGMACEEAYDKALGEVNRPMNRMKRGATAVKKGAVELVEKGKKGVAELTYKGKRVKKMDVKKLVTKPQGKRVAKKTKKAKEDGK